MRWILIIHCCSDYTPLFGYYHANEQGSVLKGVPCHINMDTHAAARWLPGSNSPENTAPYFFFFSFTSFSPQPNTHTQDVCVRTCVLVLSTSMHVCVIQFHLCSMYSGVHLSVRVPLWTCVLPFLLKCNYSCVNRTEAPDATLHY